MSGPFDPVQGKTVPEMDGTAGPNCIPCGGNQGGCYPDCCTSYTQVVISNVQISNFNTSTGTTATLSWTDTPSRASDEFQWGVGGVYNHTSSPSGHTISLTGLPRYTDVNFMIDAYGLTYPDCLTPAQHFGNFTPYYPHTATLTIYIWASDGTIWLDGAARANGATVTVYSPDNFSISASVSYPGTYFMSWSTSLGTLQSSTSPSTVIDFFGTQTSGGLSLIVNVSTRHWGGYTYSGHHLTEVSGDIVLPTEVSWTPQNQTTGLFDACTGVYFGSELLAAWVGLGGVNNSEGLWQAGVTIGVNQSGGPTLTMWVMDTNGLGGGCPVYSKWGGWMTNQTNGASKSIGVSAWEPRLGDDLSVFVQFGNVAGTGPVGNVTICDRSQDNKCWPETSPNEAYPLWTDPDETTADWIAENPWPAYNSSPCYNVENESFLVFTNMTESQAFGSGNLIPSVAPMGAFTLGDYYYYSGNWHENFYVPSQWGLYDYSWGGSSFEPCFEVWFISAPRVPPPG